MSRHRDYQPIIDRAYGQIEIAQRREAKLRERKDECHREMLRAQNAARMADEEVAYLREQLAGLEFSARDLRRRNAQLVVDKTAADNAVARLVGELDEARHPLRTKLRRLKAWAGGRWRDMLSTAAEA
jgi:chromosome segregation ATPase